MEVCMVIYSKPKVKAPLVNSPLSSTHTKDANTKEKEKLAFTYKLAKIIRTVTISPVMVVLLISCLYFMHDGAFLNGAHAWLMVLFLSFLPVLSYPLSYVIPSVKKKGREGQRSLAIYFSIIGYLLGCVVVFAFSPAPIEKIVYLTYLFSGLLIFLFSHIFKFKASGHACGVAGPIWALCYFVHPAFALLLSVLFLVFWSSLRLKRHTTSQLIVGSFIPLCSMILSMLIFGM